MLWLRKRKSIWNRVRVWNRDSSHRTAALSPVALSGVQAYAIRSSRVLIYYIARNRKCFADVMSSGTKEPEGQGGNRSPLSSYFGRTVTLLGGRHIMTTTMLLAPHIFRPSYGPLSCSWHGLWTLPFNSSCSANMGVDDLLSCTCTTQVIPL